MKRLIALLLTAVLVLGLFASALAAKPTVSIDSSSKNLTVKRGRTVKLVYYLKSKSYNKIGSYWRSRFESVIVSNSLYDRTVAKKNISFTGNIKYTLKWKPSKTLNPGVYTNVFATWYRNDIYSDNWYINKIKRTHLTLK